MLFMIGSGGDSCQMWDTSCKPLNGKDPWSCTDFYRAEIKIKGEKKKKQNKTLSLSKCATLNSVH